MNKKPAKYIITCGPFDGQTNNIKQARIVLKKHIENMKMLYNSNDTYTIYKAVESKKFGD